jgi:hypothetical protein
MTPDFLVQFLANLFKIVVWMTCFAVVLVAPLPKMARWLDLAVIVAGLVWTMVLDERRKKATA